ncbi:MAG: hypothetical protein QW745_05825 [Thermoplasmata archaeon]
MKESFVYRDRRIRYGMKRIGKYYLNLYEDVKNERRRALKFNREIKQK